MTSSRNMKMCCLILVCLSLVLNSKAAGTQRVMTQKKTAEAGHSATAAQIIYKVAGCHNLQQIMLN